jgi:flagellar biosynthesis protein FlhG
MVKALRERTDLRRIDVIVSNARTEPHAHAIFARLEGVVSPRISVALRYGGFVPEDQNVRRATALRRPLVEVAPHSPASRAYERLTNALLTAEVNPHGGVAIGVERTLSEAKKASDAA